MTKGDKSASRLKERGRAGHEGALYKGFEGRGGEGELHNKAARSVLHDGAEGSSTSVRLFFANLNPTRASSSLAKRTSEGVLHKKRSGGALPKEDKRGHASQRRRARACFTMTSRLLNNGLEGGGGRAGAGACRGRAVAGLVEDKRI